MSEFKYADFTEKELNLVVTDIKNNLTSAFTPLTLSIPGRRGEIFRGNDIKSKKITIEFVALHDTEEQWIEHEEALSAFFNQFLQGKDDELYPLILHDSDTIYWSYISGISEPERIADRHSSRKFSVEFMCADGYGVKEVVSQEINQSTFDLKPTGNLKTEPVFTFIPTSDVEEIGISTEGDDYIYLGGDALDDKKNLRVMNDPCNTLASWTAVNDGNLTFHIENGKIPSDASMESFPNSFSAKNYGTFTEEKKWYGPCRQQFFSRALDDYRIKCRVQCNVDDARAYNKFELYLLGTSGQRVGKFMLKDASNSKKVGAYVQLGSVSKDGVSVYSSTADGISSKPSEHSIKKKTIKYKEKVKKTDKKKGIKKGQVITKTTSVKYSNEKNEFTSFYGWIELTKVGNEFTATIQPLNKDGTATGKTYTGTYVDEKKEYCKPIAGVAVYIAKMNTTEDKLGVKVNDDDFYCCHVIADEIKTPVDKVIAREGDEITIDCANGRVYKNGEIFMNRLGIGSNFLSLTPNEVHTISVSPPPSDTAKWSVSYQPKFP